MIFGLEHSKLIFHNIGGDNELELPYSILDPTWSIPAFVKHQSVYDGTRNFLLTEDYSSFKVRVHLFKETDPAYRFQQINAYKGLVVEFYPHREVDSVLNLSNSYAEFFVQDVKPWALVKPDRYDICEIYFISTEYTTLTARDNTIITEGGTVITTEDGDEITIE